MCILSLKGIDDHFGSIDVYSVLDIIVARRVSEISTISSAYSCISMWIKIVPWSTQFVYVVKYLIYIKTLNIG